jgi:hypothetical protein
MSGRALRMLAAVAVLGSWSGSAVARESEPEDLNRIIQRLEQKDRQAREDGFVLESFPVEQQPNDPRRKSMKLSVGEVGGEPEGSPFDEKGSNYLLDPLTPYEPPPVGLNLKLQF